MGPCRGNRWHDGTGTDILASAEGLNARERMPQDAGVAALGDREGLWLAASLRLRASLRLSVRRVNCALGQLHFGPISRLVHSVQGPFCSRPIAL